jgi:hypothetical protein
LHTLKGWPLFEFFSLYYLLNYVISI